LACVKQSAAGHLPLCIQSDFIQLIANYLLFKICGAVIFLAGSFRRGELILRYMHHRPCNYTGVGQPLQFSTYNVFFFLTSATLVPQEEAHSEEKHDSGMAQVPLPMTDVPQLHASIPQLQHGAPVCIHGICTAIQPAFSQVGSTSLPPPPPMFKWSQSLAISLIHYLAI